MTRGQRTPEEQQARSRCRAIARAQGSYVRKQNPHTMQLGACPIWPDGLLTAFHGWADLENRLRACVREPELVTDGIYVREEEPRDEDEDYNDRVASQHNGGDSYDPAGHGRSSVYPDP